MSLRVLSGARLKSSKGPCTDYFNITDSGDEYTTVVDPDITAGLMSTMFKTFIQTQIDIRYCYFRNCNTKRYSLKSFFLLNNE